VPAKVAVNVPVCVAIEVLTKPLLLVMVAALAARDVPTIAAPTINALTPRMARAETRPPVGGDAKSLLGAGIDMQFIVFLRYGLLQLLRATR
jgi:hypothetical protein